MIVPAGARHNVINSREGPLRLYTICAPPEHKDAVVKVTKDEAEARRRSEEWDGVTSEYKPKGETWPILCTTCPTRGTRRS